MTKQDIQNIMQRHIQLLIKEAEKGYRTNGKAPGYKMQKFFMLSVSLLHPTVSYHTFGTYYGRFMSQKESSSEISVMFANYFSRTKDKDGNLLFLRLPSYVKNKYTAVCITEYGLDEWFLLRNTLPLQKAFESERMSEEEIRRYYFENIADHSKNALTDHSNDVFDCYSETVNLLAENGSSFGNVYREALRADSFQPVFAVRSTKGMGSIAPDVSFSYSDPKYHSNPVAVEIDLGTESVSTTLANKFRDYMQYSEKISKEDGASPLTSLVCFKNGGDTEPPAKPSPSMPLPFSDREIKLIRSTSWTRALQMISVFGLEDYTFEEKSVAELVGSLRKDNDPDVTDIAGMEAIRFVDMIFGIALKYNQAFGKKMTVAEGYRLAGILNDDSRKTLETRRAEEQDLRSFRKARILFDTLHGDGTMLPTEAFLSGFCLACVPDGRTGEAYRTLLPYAFGMKEAKSFFAAIGLPDKPSYFCPCFPLQEYGKSYSLWLRNAFKTGGTFVFFEDLGFDMGAFDRIRKYLLLPSDYGIRSLLVIIVNDDLSTATGRSLSELTGELGLCEREYANALSTCYGRSGTMPFRFHEGTDFCFIRRSEYLSGKSKQMRPFIKIGNEIQLEKVLPKDYDAIESPAFRYREGQTVNGIRGITKEFAGYRNT